MSEKLENLNLGVNTKKRFTIDGDENRILEIDVQDMSIMSRKKQGKIPLGEPARYRS